MKAPFDSLLLTAALCGLSLQSLPGAEVAAGAQAAAPLEWNFGHDADGRIKSLRDPGGNETTFDYAWHPGAARALKSLTRRFPGGEVVFGFDQAGRLTGMTDTLGAVSYGYDDRGRLNRVARENCHAITYTHDALDRIASIRVGDFYRIEYRYDFLGRIQSMDTPAGKVTYEYQTGAGQVIRSLPNGVKTCWKRQPNGELETITHGFFKRPDDTPNSVLAQYTYQHGPDGRIAAIRETSPHGEVVKRYGYDTMGRLTSATGPGGKQYQYGYDALGNRTKATATGAPAQTCTFDWAGRLASVNGQPCVHDASGNLTDLTLDGIARQYRYHPDGRLAEARAGNEIARYRYDGFGRLVERKTNAETTRFVTDPLSPIWQPLVMEDTNGARMLVVWDGLAPLALVGKNEVEWLLGDHAGSARLITDVKGATKTRSEHGPFGEFDGPRLADADLRPGFVGLLWDDAAGGHLTLARLYCSHTGTWHQTEPIKTMLAGSPHDYALYGYCGYDPINSIDLDGFEHRRVDGRSIAPFTNYMNHLPLAMPCLTYEYGLQLGVGSGKQSIEELLLTADGRYQVIVIWGSRPGQAPDAYRAPFLDTAGLARIGLRIVPIHIKSVTAHSAGNFLRTLGNSFVYREDPAGYLLSQSEINTPGIVSNLTGVDLNSVLKRGLFGVSFTGASNNLAAAAYEATGDAARFALGVSTLVSRTLSAPFTKEGPFASHSLKPMIGELESRGFIPETGTFTKVDVIYVDDYGRIERFTYDYPCTTVDSVDGLKRIQTTPNQERHFRRDTLQSEWQLERIKEHDHEFRVPATRPEVLVPGPQGGPTAKQLTDHLMRSLEVASEVIAKRNVHGIEGQTASIGTRMGYASRGDEAAAIEYRDRMAAIRPGVNSIDSFQDRRVSSSLLGSNIGGGGPGAGVAPSPSPVGGVYLGGAGGAIEGLGLLSGLRLDANGNLVLVGEELGDIKLPALRLADVVTIFRSVYLHGEGPTVTIDPNPENPENSAMIIRHSKATEDTYVGWVLYQADRLMKGYGQGVDNITTKDIESRVPGYAEMLERVYFGGADPRQEQKGGNWERFWIVPAEARRVEGARRELTLFDVPLKVRTQKMKWVKNALVDDLNGKSSPGALAFTGWFTTNYDGIAAEQLLLPPEASGILAPVRVFAELRQIALITAIAEKLRDQGVPLPFWMRDYEVPKVAFERFTPGLEVTRQRRQGDVIRTARIFGGVELSADSKAVKTYATAAEVKAAPPAVRAEVERAFKLAGGLESAVAEKVRPAVEVPLTVNRVDSGDRSFRAVALPGANTLALHPCQLEEVDLAVPLGGGRDIRLVRQFHSFFDPKGPWGPGWTMDLPRLQEVRVPDSRQDGKVSYRIGHELWTPLNSAYARFLKTGAVAELGGSRLLVPDADGPFFGLGNARPEYFKDVNTLVVFLKNGQQWHFTPSGDLIAIEDGPQVTVYERRGDGAVPRIIGLLDGSKAAEIELQYSDDGILSGAAGRSFGGPDQTGIKRSYAYGPTGRLSGVGSENGTVGYGYRKSLVTTVTWTGVEDAAAPQNLATFEYNDRGQVVAETQGRQTWRHSLADDPGGIQTTTAAADDAATRTRVRYDGQMRPLEATDPDGTRTAWKYRPNGGVETTVTTPDGPTITAADSGDGRRRTVRADGLPTLAAQFDAGGNLTRMEEGGQVLLTQQWRPDGQLAAAETEAQGIQCRYTGRGLLASVVVHPPRSGEKLSQWQETKVDERGNPLEITDSTGLKLLFGYDAAGAINGAVQKTPKGNLGYNIERDDEGRVQAVKSSWGDAACAYAPDGSLASVRGTRAGQTSAVELAGGLVRKITGFDGGVTTFDYHAEGPLSGAPRGLICANGLKLAHEYQPDGRLAAVKVGETRRVRLRYDEHGRISSYAWEPAAADN